MPDDPDAARDSTRAAPGGAARDSTRAAPGGAAGDAAGDSAVTAARDGTASAVRDEAARAADHAGIDELAGALIPALIAKLGTLNIGELEVREGDWRIRLRRPAGAGFTYGRRATDRPSRAHPGHEQHGHAPGAPEPHRVARTQGVTGQISGQASGLAVGRPAAGPAAGHLAGHPGAVPSTNGSDGPTVAPVGPGRPGSAGHLTAGENPSAGAVTAAGAGAPQIATSPAVGVFQPGPRAVGGTRVRAGDRLGFVDMLGVPQEVVSPVDGIVVGVIVEAGTAVEYGQELVHLEPATPVEGR